MPEVGAQLHIEPCGEGLSLVGEIDAHTAPRLQSALDDRFAAGAATVVLAMPHVTFMDSSGLRVVITATETARARGGDVILRSPTRVVQRLLEVTGLTEHLTLDTG